MVAQCSSVNSQLVADAPIVLVERELIHGETVSDRQNVKQLKLQHIWGGGKRGGRGRAACFRRWCVDACKFIRNSNVPA